jgi:hypothetical protein
MRSTLRLVHAGVAWLFVAVLLGQVFLAGSALANLGGSGDFGLHVEFGYTAVGLAALAVVLTAAAARMPRRNVAVSFGLLVLYIVQTALPGFRASTPAIAALHPVNAMLLFGVATWYARHAWSVRAVGSSASPASPVATSSTASVASTASTAGRG